MIFIRFKAFFLSLIILMAFSVFLLYRFDYEIKKNTLDIIQTQLKTDTNTTFKGTNPSLSSVHNHAILDSIKSQSFLKNLWISQSEALSRDLNTKSSSPKDDVERKAYVTKNAEIDMGSISFENLNQSARIAIPVMIEQSCVSCHNLNIGDVAGIVNAELLLGDNLLPIMKSNMLEVGLILFAASFVLMMSVVMSANSFAKITLNIKSVIQAAIEGNFSSRVKAGGFGIFNEAGKITNRLLETLDRSINNIDSKIATIFVYKKSLYSSNPLTRITELVTELTTLFIFKTKIEGAQSTKAVYKELQNVISKYIKYKYLVFVETFKGEVVSGYRLENDVESKIVLGEVKNIESRLDTSSSNVMFDDGKGCKFIANSTGQFHVIDLQMRISSDIIIYYSIIMNSKKELLEKENSVSRIYNYVREARPIINNIVLVKGIEEASYSDPLTKAYNRLYLEKYTATIEEKLKSGINFGIMMLDIDHFKKINDTYGHSVGDAGIVLIVECIRKVIKPSDRVIRYGGEEFVVIVEGVDFEETYRLADKIRNTFSMEKRCVGKNMDLGFPKSASIGVSSMPIFSKNVWEAINQADTALYVAKESGRNRVIRYSRELKGKNDDSETKPNTTAQTHMVNAEDDDDEAFLESLKLNG